jgi:hypothetical protein
MSRKLHRPVALPGRANAYMEYSGSVAFVHLHLVFEDPAGPAPARPVSPHAQAHLLRISR